MLFCRLWKNAGVTIPLIVPLSKTWKSDCLSSSRTFFRSYTKSCCLKRKNGGIFNWITNNTTALYLLILLPLLKGNSWRDWGSFPLMLFSHCCWSRTRSLLKPYARNEHTNSSYTYHKQVWTGHRSGDIRIWSAENGQLVDTIRGAHKQEVRHMIMVKDNVWSCSRCVLVRSP